jgi:hypothetical protein
LIHWDNFPNYPESSFSGESVRALTRCKSWITNNLAGGNVSGRALASNPFALSRWHDADSSPGLVRKESRHGKFNHNKQGAGREAVHTDKLSL